MRPQKKQCEIAFLLVNCALSWKCVTQSAFHVQNAQKRDVLLEMALFCSDFSGAERDARDKKLRGDFIAPFQAKDVSSQFFFHVHHVLHLKKSEQKSAISSSTSLLCAF